MRLQRHLLRAVFASVLIAIVGCSHPGMTPHDGSSVSLGPPRGGVLNKPAAMPRAGAGFVTPNQWWLRGLRYGVEELVSTIVHVGRAISLHAPGTTVSVADLSLPGGGRSRWHRSHQTGRDVDLLFLVVNGLGEPTRADVMRRFDASGRPVGEAEPAVFFDDAGNWALVRALIENPIAQVQYIFISDDLKQRVIDYAIAHEEPEDVILTAAWLLHQPGDSLPHDDHMHVRIYCPREDLDFGCYDFGLMRWHKRDVKYADLAERNLHVPRMPPPYHATAMLLGH